MSEPDKLTAADESLWADREFEQAAEPAGGSESAAAAPAVEIPQVACWRCGKSIPITSAHCPVCKARSKHMIPIEYASQAIRELAQTESPVVGDRGKLSENAPRNTRPAVMGVIYFFLAFLALSIIEAGVAHVVLRESLDDAAMGKDIRVLITVFCGISVVLTLVALTALPRPLVFMRSGLKCALGWLAGPALLAVALGINIGYHALLQSFLKTPDWLLHDNCYQGASLTWLILAICVQPGIFEELFFRHLTLGHLRGVMGTHSAVWISSIIFGMAHLGVPLSIPALIVVGVALGYARVWSGSLLLPMLMHAAHNGVVVYLELQR